MMKSNSSFTRLLLKGHLSSHILVNPRRLSIYHADISSSSIEWKQWCLPSLRTNISVEQQAATTLDAIRLVHISARFSDFVGWKCQIKTDRPEAFSFGPSLHPSELKLVNFIRSRKTRNPNGWIWFELSVRCARFVLCLVTTGTCIVWCASSGLCHGARLYACDRFQLQLRFLRMAQESNQAYTCSRDWIE
jgi:hypothetical protein